MVKRFLALLKKKIDLLPQLTLFQTNTQLALSVSQSGAPDSRFLEIRDYGLCRLFLLMKESDSQTLEAHWSMSFFRPFYITQHNFSALMFNLSHNHRLCSIGMVPREH